MENFEYSGTEVLENLQEAVNYNNSLVNLVLNSHSLNPELKVLDFGAGVGTFSSMFKDKGVNLDCFEIDKTQCETLKSLDFNVFDSFDQIEDGTYDFIYTLNVLEHIEDHGQALKDLKKKLKPGGKLFIFVPAYQSLYTNFDKMVGHYRRYHKADLRELIKESGYQLDKISYFDSVGFLAAYTYKVLKFTPENVTKDKIIFFDRIAFPFNKLTDPLFSSFLGKNLYAICTNG